VFCTENSDEHVAEKHDKRVSSKSDHTSDNQLECALSLQRQLCPLLNNHGVSVTPDAPLLRGNLIKGYYGNASPPNK